jgi:hypothetical protein
MATKKTTKKAIVKKVTKAKPAKAHKAEVGSEVVKSNTPETKLAEISTDLSGLETRANSIVIATNDDVVLATEFLTGVKARQKRVEELRKFFVDPLNQQVKKINDMFRPPAEKYKSMEAIVKRKIADYTIAEERKRIEAERKLQEQHQKQVEKDIAKGKPVEYGLTPTIEKPEATVRTETGSATTKKVWKFQLANLAELVSACVEKPELIKFLQLNETAVRGAVAEGARNIPGVTIFEDIEVSVRAN